MIRAAVIHLMLEEELERGGELEHERRHRHEAGAQEHTLRGRGEVQAVGVKTTATNSSAAAGMAGTIVAPIAAFLPDIKRPERHRVGGSQTDVGGTR